MGFIQNDGQPGQVGDRFAFGFGAGPGAGEGDAEFGLSFLDEILMMLMLSPWVFPWGH